MLASASTWLYNATLEVACSLQPPRKIAASFATEAADIASLAGDADALILKTHGLERSFRPSVADRATAIIITIRDPLDAIASLIEHNGFTFGHALELTVCAMHT